MLKCYARLLTFILILPIILKAQQQDTACLIRELVEKIDNIDVGSMCFTKTELNNQVYELIFKNSADSVILKKASECIGKLLESESEMPYFINTYANLLYKRGKIKEAILWQTKAVSLAPQDIEIICNLSKMKTGQPTWHVKNNLEPFLKKKIVEPATISSWPEILFPKISDDGKYVSYSLSVGGKIYKNIFNTITHSNCDSSKFNSLFAASDTIGSATKEDTSFLKFITKNEIIFSRVINDRLLVRSKKSKTDSGELFVLSVKDGSRIKVPAPDGGVLSPTADYVVYYDHSIGNYKSFFINSCKEYNITETIHVDWTIYDIDIPDALSWSQSVTGWTADGSGVLLSDEFDLWLVSLNNCFKPKNITNSYGKLNKIFFLPMNEGFDDIIFNKTDTLILRAFSRLTKQNGFYEKVIMSDEDPKLFSMGDYIYYIPRINTSDPGMNQIKAKNSDIWLLRRGSAHEFPNYFITKDFINFDKVTDVHPEHNYNWITTQLINYYTPDGGSTQGILYKPENFDPGKKYPLIVYCYEKLTNTKNSFPIPKLSNGPLDILSYVSDGYLVFCPDIHYVLGKPGMSAYNAVSGGLDTLFRLSFVDTNAIGMQGHSFGGYEVNFLITHSNRLAAACAAAAPSNLVSGYGGLSHGNNFRHSIFETGQMRIGSTLWENIDVYIKNSPVFFADKITAPLLIMHNPKDDAVPYSEGLQMFCALKRLNKPVWLLTYEDEGHTINKEVNQIDYTLRMKQFFDHYLKGKHPPRWMTTENLLNVNVKDYINGLNLTVKNKCSKICPVCNN